MPELKIGDEITIKGKIEEIRETEKGKFYYIKFEDGETMMRIILLPASSKNIVS